MTWASSASVLARLPSAFAYWRTCAGSTITAGKPSPRQAVDHQTLITTRRLQGDKDDLLITQLLRERRETCFRSVNRQNQTQRMNVNVELGLRNVDPDKLGNHRIPSPRRRSGQALAQSGSCGPSDCSGSMEQQTGRQAEQRASRPWDETGSRLPPHPNPSWIRAVQTYKDEGRVEHESIPSAVGIISPLRLSTRSKQPRSSGAIGRSRTRSIECSTSSSRKTSLGPAKDTAPRTWPSSATSASTSSATPRSSLPSTLVYAGPEQTPHPPQNPSVSGSDARWPDGTQLSSPDPSPLYPVNLDSEPCSMTKPPP